MHPYAGAGRSGMIKLTKITFEEYAKQIQEWYEKAEKYNKIVMQGTLPLVEVTIALEIVERLKKKLEDFRFMNEHSSHKTIVEMAVIHDVHTILQKILDNEKTVDTPSQKA